MEYTLGNINVTLSEFDKRLSTAEGKVSDVERSCHFISDENDERKTEYVTV
jgi:hypothetical protein